MVRSETSDATVVAVRRRSRKLALPGTDAAQHVDTENRAALPRRPVGMNSHGVDAAVALVYQPGKALKL